MSRLHADIRIEGDEEDVQALLRVLMYIREFEKMGTCQTIKLVVDGDGSASIRAFIKNDQGTLNPIELPENMRQAFRVKVQAGNGFRVWIGE